MRLIGMLLMGLFMLQPHRVEASAETQVVLGRTQIEARAAACVVVESPVGWMSGCEPQVRHRQAINRRRRWKRLLSRLRHLGYRVELSGKRRRRRARRQTSLETVSDVAASACQNAPTVKTWPRKKSGYGRPATVPTNHVCCIQVGCKGYGRLGPHPDHWIVGAGTYPTKNNGRLQIYQCQWCKTPFSETQGTMFFGLKTPWETVCLALVLLAEGTSIRTISRALKVKPNTVLLWLRKAGQHSEQVSNYLMRDLDVSQAQMDELWTFVYKKEKTLSAWEKLNTEYGDTWIWVAFDPVSKLVLALVVGEREETQAVGLLQQLKSRLVNTCMPLFTSDQLPHYASALLKVFGRWMQPERKGTRGRHPNPRQTAPGNLQYATNKKKREKGQVVSLTTEVVFGNQAAITERLEASMPGTKVNTSFVERFNLTLRHLVSRLRRKTLAFSKKREYLVWHLHLSVAYYHLVREHRSLRQRLPEPVPTRGSPKLWQQRTPAVAAGLTDHIWDIQELMSFRVTPVVMP